MIKPRDISKSIDNIRIPREHINTGWQEYSKSPLPILIVGPARSGKSCFCCHRCQNDNYMWKAISGNTHSNNLESTELRKNPYAVTGIFIHFPDYKAIQSHTMFFYQLQKDILTQFSNHVLGRDAKLVQAFEKKTGFASESAFDFFRVLGEFTHTKDFFYCGKINLYFCGIQYIYPDILKLFLEYLRAFMDHVYGNPELERFTLTLTSVQDGYHLTETPDNICSPLNALKRIYMVDFNKNEFSRFLIEVEQACRFKINDPTYLYSLTNGDIHLTKSLLTFCEANIIDSPVDISQRTTVIKRGLIDQAVDYILSPPNVECMPPFRVLKRFIHQYDEVRDVLYQLNSGADMVPMTDISGVYTLPESSGAVVKIEKKKKYGYIFRNEIYRRFVEKYIREEEQKVESIISETFGKGDMSIPATLASAVRHEMSSPIGVITAELSRLLQDSHMNNENIECLQAIQAANIRLSAINSFLEGSWGQKHSLETIEFNKYIGKNVLVFQPHLFRRNIRFTFDFDPHIKSIKIDTGALKMALINLVVNARDAILPNGSGTIAIKTKIEKQGLKLIIKDDGVGMDQYTLNQILEYGFSTKLNGKGIGLTLCKTAIRRMNAVLDVDSVVGKGTAVSIIFRRD
jgi:anti-sigma regulatory factor (Ser/Thr protein kinase)